MMSKNVRNPRRGFLAGFVGAVLVLGAALSAPALANAAEGPIGGNPYGCKVYIDNAHLSGGFASVHGGIKGCTSVPGERFVSITVQKQGWAQWHNMATYTGFKSGGTTAALDVNSKFVCTNSSSQNYRGVADVRVSASSSGPHYYGTLTGTEERFGCDRP